MAGVVSKKCGAFRSRRFECLIFAVELPVPV